MAVLHVEKSLLCVILYTVLHDLHTETATRAMLPIAIGHKPPCSLCPTGCTDCALRRHNEHLGSRCSPAVALQMHATRVQNVVVHGIAVTDINH